MWSCMTRQRTVRRARRANEVRLVHKATRDRQVIEDLPERTEQMGHRERKAIEGRKVIVVPQAMMVLLERRDLPDLKVIRAIKAMQVQPGHKGLLARKAPQVLARR